MSTDPPHAQLVTWNPHLSLGVTGHRDGNAALDANRAEVESVIASVFDAIDETLGGFAIELSPVRLHSLLASGVDQIAAELALARDWELVAPLPFGAELNLAINADAGTPADVRALLEGQSAADKTVEGRAEAIRSLSARARCFEIADRDAEIAEALLASLARPDDAALAMKYQSLRSDNAALAGRVMLDRSDLLIAVWDGANPDLPGGTGHTIRMALQQGTPVVLIDPAAPQGWSLLTRPQQVGHVRATGLRGQDAAALARAVETAIAPQRRDLEAIARETFRSRTTFGFGIFRRIETLFGGRSTRSGTTKAIYENPEAIAEGSAAPILSAASDTLSPDDEVVAGLRNNLFPLFAWADAVSARLADAYRSSMSISFMLSAFAIIAGIAYLPFDLAAYKWIFAAVELALLVAIILITFGGNRRSWHRRWFETRRVAEYLRFAPGMLLTGVFRPIGRWPRGDTRQWPERFARDALRDAGLPGAKIDREYLRAVLSRIVLPHVASQRAYHEAKAVQLDRVHRRIDKSAEYLFLAAVLSVSIYLLIELAAYLGLIYAGAPYAIAKAFTFMGVAFPTLGANLAGIRYFGDFERFSGISHATSAKLSEVETRIELLLGGDPRHLTYGNTAGLVRMVDEVVFSEIESWQAVYGSKALALPA